MSEAKRNPKHEADRFDPAETERGEESQAVSRPPLCGVGTSEGNRRRDRSKERKKKGGASRKLTAEQRLLLLDTWLRSKLPAKDFAPLVGISAHTLYDWKKKFEAEGPAGLEDKPRQSRSNKLNETIRRAILMLKESHPDWGEDRIHDMLVRSQGLSASPRSIAKVLKEAGHETKAPKKRRHPDKKRRFERSGPNQLWQTDLFTFMLKRQNRRVHLVGFMDDHSRFMVGYGLHATASGALVREVFESGIASYGAPEEVLTDNGSQYTTWRGKSAFTKLCEKRGIKQIVARPRHPQTLGKIERFWGTLWRECLEAAVFLDLEDASKRIGLYIDHYNFHRTHQGIDGLVPADRFFRSAPEVKATLAERVAKNAHELARDGLPRKDFYLTGRVGDVGISLHAEGEQVVLTREDGERETVNLSATGRRQGDEEGLEELPQPLAKQGELPQPLSPHPDLAPTPGDEDRGDQEPGVTTLDEAVLAQLREVAARKHLDDGEDDDLASSDDLESGSEDASSDSGDDTENEEADW